MSKVFRLHSQGGKNDKTDWFSCQAYGNTEINDIKDPDGAKASKQITSIPSPFARIDLVKTAFAEVVNRKDLDGTTIYHRMVSDALDVAEIFFNYEKHKDKFRIVVWDRRQGLANLRSSHPQVADTLSLFLQQDAQTYNFDLWDQVFLLQYLGPGFKQMQIVGMTSPCTLFISTANDHTKVSENVFFGNDRPFDGKYQPLYKRDEQFVKYLYTFRNSVPNFATLFKEVNDYMDLTFNTKLSDETKRYISNLAANAIDSYAPISIDTASNVTILGHPFHLRGTHSVVDSDFEIRSSIAEGKLPLVLPCEKGNAYADWKYTQDKWGNEHAAPAVCDTPIEERFLPFDDTPYPYLTISDLLEDTIIELPDSEMSKRPDGTTLGGFNSKWYFDGNRTQECKRATLLPLKPLFFQYFTPDEVMNGVNGKSLISIAPNASGYRVELSIPTKRGHVTMSRLYMSSRNEARNEGEYVQLNNSFAFAMMTPVRFIDPQNAAYRMALMTDYRHSNSMTMKPYAKGLEVQADGTVVRNEREENNAVTKIMHLDHKAFECLQVCDHEHNAQGIILPKFKTQQQAGNTYSFAIDFGTTNTHIEYRKGADPSKPLSMDAEGSVLQYLCHYGPKRYTFDAVLMPNVIGDTFAFPMRSALCEPIGINYGRPVAEMANVNPAFTYEKRTTYAYNEVHTNLKWDNDDERAKHYIRSLMLIIRSKVLLEGGSLPDTRVAWFYPTSMSGFKHSQLSNMWDDAYRSYFGGNTANIRSYTESEAPYIAYKAAHNVNNNMVTIDIGGGTTDVGMIEGGKLTAITSFRFAADALFGSAFTDGQGQLNGIVNHFKDVIASILVENGLKDLNEILDRLTTKNKSEDIASFLFSLTTNRAVIEQKVADKVDFNALLNKDTDFKLVILLFYIAIIYHVANILKLKGFPMPRVIAFSGNGSKVLSAIGSRQLQGLTKAILEGVYNSVAQNGLNVDTSSDNPKELTCKGGLQNEEPMELSDARRLIVALKTSQSLYGDNDTYATAITEQEKMAVVADVNSFLDFVQALDRRYSLRDNFGLSRTHTDLIGSVCRRDLDEYLSKGIHRKLQEMQNDKQEKVQETMFFYPMIGMLDALSAEIFNMLHGGSTSQNTPVTFTYLRNEGEGWLKEVEDSADAQFRLWQDGNDEAEGLFCFSGNMANALANRDATFDGVCNFSGDGNTTIVTLANGKACKQQDGYWKVIEKATVKIS